MKLTVVAILACLPLCSIAQVSELSDHTRPRATVRTFHAKCVNGRLGMIRLDPTTIPPTICASVQDGSRPEQCSAQSSGTASRQIRAKAEVLCH